MTNVSVVKMKQLILATAIASAAFGSASAPSNAADYAPVVVPGTKHVRTTWYYSDWRDRCAYAGYYCLYAYDGFVYHYPWDDIAYAYGYARRHHSRYRVRY
jgi:hypothetical protein